MINNKNVEDYFNLLKSKGIIAEYWDYDGCSVEDDYIKLRYIHKSGKRSSYRFLKERVIQELRDYQLRQILD
jgi:hypothetical protein